MDENEEILSVIEASKLTGIKPSTIRQSVCRGKITIYKKSGKGGKCFITRSEILRYAEGFRGKLHTPDEIEAIVANRNKYAKYYYNLYKNNGPMKKGKETDTEMAKLIKKVRGENLIKYRKAHGTYKILDHTTRYGVSLKSDNPNASAEILGFISNIISSGAIIKDGVFAIQWLFTNCDYLFAVMLNDTFEGGSIVYNKKLGNVLYLNNDIAYNICGVYDNWSEGDLIDIHELSDEELDKIRKRKEF